MDEHTTTTSGTDDIAAIYDALRHGRGREQVNDGNVDALIERARQEKNAQLELLLREWRSPCGDDPESPVLPPAVPR